MTYILSGQQALILLYFATNMYFILFVDFRTHIFGSKYFRRIVMRLTPREIEKLMLHTAGELAKERLGKGIKLNYVETIAYISSEIMELAREGKTVKEVTEAGRKMLTRVDVMDGIAEMVTEVQIEATFDDGTKLVTVHEPIC